MARDPLQTVLALRKRELDTARAGLSTATAAAAHAHEEAKRTAYAIEREANRASDPSGSDGLVEAFAAWLPTARHASEAARKQHEMLEAEAARRRAEVQACRTALKTIETAIAERRTAQAAADLRRTQAVLDEIAARPQHLES